MTVIYNGPLTLPTETQLPVTTVTYTAKTKLIVAFIGGAADYDAFTVVGPTFIMGGRQNSYINGLLTSFKNTTVSGDIFSKKKQAVVFDDLILAKQPEQHRVRCYYYGYDKAETVLFNKIKEDMQSPLKAEKCGVIIVGHSLGGYKAGKLVEKLINTNTCKSVDFLGTLDPVGEVYFTNILLPNPKPKYWINVYSHWNTVVKKDANGKEDRSFDFDNFIASAGNRWDMDHAAYAKTLSLNIDAADIGHGNAAGMMGKKKNGISVDSKLLELTKEYLS